MAPPEAATPDRSAATAAAKARAQALAAYAPLEPATQWVEYRSHGRLLIIGPAADAWPLAKALEPQLECVVLATARPAAPPPAAPPAPTVHGRVHSLTGYLGAFELEIETESGQTSSSEHAFGPAHAAHDLVLDLGSSPTIAREVPPLGYCHAPDAHSRDQALAELPEMVGAFEKPRFILYDPDICAHGERGQAGCHNCLDVCAADAPFSVGERIEVNLNLCQGCGSCTIVCPTGALTYATPPVNDLMDALRRLLTAYRHAGGTTPVLAFHSEAYDPDLLRELPGHVLPVAVEDIGSLGLEAWFTLLAYGAHQIQLLTPEGAPRSLLQATRGQIELAEDILRALGDPNAGLRVALLTPAEAVLEAAIPPELVDEPATFATLGNKREVFHMALAHLYQRASGAQERAPLPEHAPFGAIEVDGDTCTLCMACVSVCPAAAVQGGGDEPRLWFREDHCVQCGLCETACPEDAINLVPQLDFAAHLEPGKRLLNEERMQLCLDCGKPFATAKVVSRMKEKLQAHWMFQTDEARQILLLCEDCRIRRVFDDRSPIQAHRE